jgi:hypothetical protein
MKDLLINQGLQLVGTLPLKVDWLLLFGIVSLVALGILVFLVTFILISFHLGTTKEEREKFNREMRRKYPVRKGRNPIHSAFPGIFPEYMD